MYREDRFDSIKIPDNLDQVIDAAIEKGCKIQKKRTVKRIVGACSAVAAAIALFTVLCISFPTLAAQIPFIGSIFENTEKQVSYKGNYSKEADKLVTATEESIDNAYIQENNGMRVSISEVYYNSMALYLGISIECEEGFPEDFVRTENMEGYVLGYDVLTIEGEQQFSFLKPEHLWSLVEGAFKDSNTFVGIYRIDLANWRDENGNPMEVPDNFSLNLKIEKISGDLFDTVPKQYIDPDGNEVVLDETVVKTYEGRWEFDLDVQLDTSKTKTIVVDDVNDAGVGVQKVDKTPYEIKADIVIPEGREEYDYITVICDANGDMMDFQGGYVGTYQTYERNTDKVYVYVCDYYEYMDELKGIRWMPGHEGERGGYKNFKEFLDERALYGTEVVFEE